MSFSGMERSKRKERKKKEKEEKEREVGNVGFIMMCKLTVVFRRYWFVMQPLAVKWLTTMCLYMTLGLLLLMHSSAD